MNNDERERWLAELETRVGRIVDSLLESEEWEEYVDENRERDLDEFNVLLHQWRDFGITPENEGDVASLMTIRLPYAEEGGNDPGNAIDGYFGYFITIYKNEHCHNQALRRWGVI